MKKMLLQYHEKIDMISATIFLYCLLILTIIPLFYFINNEYLYAGIVLVLPFTIVLNKKNRTNFNKLLHSIFGFRR